MALQLDGVRTQFKGDAAQHDHLDSEPYFPAWADVLHPILQVQSAGC